MRWIRAHRHEAAACYLFPDPGETDRMILAAVAAASFNMAWPEGYGWEQWDPTQEVSVESARTALPGVFRRGRPGRGDDLLSMDYVHGRRCKTYVARETHGEHRGALRIDAATYEATRGGVERLLRTAHDLLARRRRPSRRR